MIFECANCVFCHILSMYVWWTFLYSVLFCCIVLRNASDASLSRMCFFICTPLFCNHCISLLYALHIFPDVHVFIGSTRMRFCHFHTVPWCIGCLGLTWQGISLSALCVWYFWYHQCLHLIIWIWVVVQRQYASFHFLYFLVLIVLSAVVAALCFALLWKVFCCCCFCC